METTSKTTKALQIIMSVVAVLYILGMAMSFLFDDLSLSKPIDYLSFRFIIFPLLLLLFLVGFLVSWKSEFLAGFIFLIWSAILIYGTFVYTEIMQLGPWIIFGLPILLQGVFYMKNHYKFRHN